MFKGRSYQGVLPYVISAVVFCIVGVTILLYYVTHFGANQLFEQDKVLNTQLTEGHVVVQVIYISPKSVPMANRGTELYLIGYADKENKIGYIGLEAKKKDRLIKQLYEDKDSLLDAPYRLEVVMLTLDNVVDKDVWQKLARDVGQSGSILGDEMNKKRFVSLTEAKVHRHRFYLIAFIFLFLGFLSLLIAYQRFSRNSRNLQAFYDLYPEMDGSLSKAMTYANLPLKDADILIYHNHLLTFGRDIRLIDLKTTKELKQMMKKVQQGTDVINIPLPILKVEQMVQKPLTIRLKKQIPLDLEELWLYLNRYFKDIKTNDLPVTVESNCSDDSSPTTLTDNESIDEELVVDLEDLD